MAGIGHFSKEEKNMHREIQIKQLPHRNYIDGLRHETSGLCEKTNSIYIVF